MGTRRHRATPTEKSCPQYISFGSESLSSIPWMSPSSCCILP